MKGAFKQKNYHAIIGKQKVLVFGVLVTVLAVSILSGCCWPGEGQEVEGRESEASECHAFYKADAETSDRVLSVVSRMMDKSLRSVTDDAAKREREENYLFISNLLSSCELDFGFAKLDDGTPFLVDTIGGCEGAYKDIPCSVVLDDKYAHGGALFPVANVTNTNIVEFVTLANQVARTGRFEYDSEFGFVMYMHSMPMSAIRAKGKQAFGMVCGFPVMEVDLFSEAYKAVLEGRKMPKEAIAEVGEKIDRIKHNDAIGKIVKGTIDAKSALEDEKK